MHHVTRIMLSTYDGAVRSSAAPRPSLVVCDDLEAESRPSDGGIFGSLSISQDGRVAIAGVTGSFTVVSTSVQEP
jgi:hypothetical protein